MTHARRCCASANDEIVPEISAHCDARPASCGVEVLCKVVGEYREVDAGVQYFEALELLAEGRIFPNSLQQSHLDPLFVAEAPHRCLFCRLLAPTTKRGRGPTSAASSPELFVERALGEKCDDR